MKSCPTCNRTYPDNTLAFCLVDGSILSAPYDPESTQHGSSTRSTDPAPTEVLPSNLSLSNPLPETILSPPPSLYKASDTPITKASQSSALAKRFIRSSIGKIILGVAMGSLLAGIMLLLNRTITILVPSGSGYITDPLYYFRSPLRGLTVPITGALYGLAIGFAIALVGKFTSFRAKAEITGLITGIAVGTILRSVTTGLSFNSRFFYTVGAMYMVDTTDMSGGWAGALIFGSILGLIIGIVFHVISANDAV